MTSLAVMASSFPPALLRSAFPASGSSATTSCALRAMLAPPAKASRQPKLPHLQGGPSISMIMWPTSPADPLQPESILPSDTIPLPIPVPINRQMRSSQSLPAPKSHSPKAAARTSLTTTTLVSHAALRSPCSGTLCHPRFGAKITAPLFGSICPATPIPIPWRAPGNFAFS